MNRILCVVIVTACVATSAAGAQSTRSRPTTSHPTTSRPTTGTASGPTSRAAVPAVAGDFGTFTLTPPKTWFTKVAPVAAGIRKAVYTLPEVKDGQGSAELVVFHFKGGAGSVEANLARWRSQMRKPEGLSDDEHCIFSKQKVDGLPVTIAEIRGDYAGDPRNPEKVTPGVMMLSAIVETDNGNYFIRTTGPEKTMQAHKEAWYKMVLTIKAGKKQ
ncbi:MAG: hypothetical protein AAF581_08275 [Planctomycetota bacterium]